MAVYYIGLLMITLSWNLIDEESKRNKGTTCKLWFGFVVLILSIIEGFRAFGVGTDTSTYAKLFLIGDFTRFEFGYQVLCNFIRLFTKNASVFLFIIALITNGLVVRAVYRISSQPCVSVFSYMALYYYFNSFNAMRQYLAVAFVLTAYTYLKDNRYLRYFILILIAVSIHNTALVGLLLFPIHFIRLRENEIKAINVLNTLFIPVIVGLVGGAIFNSVLTIFLQLFPKYSIYLGTDQFTGTNAIQQVVVNTAIFIVYVLLSRERKFAFHLGTATALSFMLSSVRLLSRFLWFFDVFSIFGLAEIWNTMVFTPRSRSIVRCVLALVCILFMTYYLSLNVMRVGHYSFVWFN